MAERIEPYPKDTKFNDLDDQVRRDEALHGKLKSIKVDGDYTVATFSTGPSYPPERQVKLQRVTDDKTSAPDGYILVCRGDCWDNPPKTSKVIAIRKKKTV